MTSADKHLEKTTNPIQSDYNPKKIENEQFYTNCVGYFSDDVTYYVIHRNQSKVGLFSNVLVFLDEIIYAINKGWIPIIDMKNYDNSYLYSNEIGRYNAWEYYFEQPLEYLDVKRFSLDAAYNSKNMIKNNGEFRNISNAPFFEISFINNEHEVKKWGNIYKKYIRLNQKTADYIADQYNSIITRDDKVLGVFCRGTDYRALRPYGHPIQPDIADVINRAEYAMGEWGCNKLFLSTEDASIRDLFIKKFNDSVVSNQREYVKYRGGSITQVSHDRENDKYLQGLEYLTSQVILSRCNCIIGSSTSGMIGTMLMSGGFEESFFYDCGVYNSKIRTYVNKLLHHTIQHNPKKKQIGN